MADITIQGAVQVLTARGWGGVVQVLQKHHASDMALRGREYADYRLLDSLKDNLHASMKQCGD